jgi:hypothetical protein
VRRYTTPVVASVRALHRAAVDAGRDLKAAKDRRVAALEAVQEMREKHGISGRDFSRIARGVYGGRR